MREIKFRYRYEQTNKLTSKLTIVTRYYTLDDLTEGIAKVYFDCEKLLSRDQYTGLKDSKGVEIYEGDILGENWGDGYIGYCNKCKSFQFIMKDFGCSRCSGDIMWNEVVEDDGKLEVIGNVWENPELLKGEVK